MEIVAWFSESWIHPVQHNSCAILLGSVVLCCNVVWFSTDWCIVLYCSVVLCYIDVLCLTVLYTVHHHWFDWMIELVGRITNAIHVCSLEKVSHLSSGWFLTYFLLPISWFNLYNLLILNLKHILKIETKSNKQITLISNIYQTVQLNCWLLFH